MPFRDSSFDAIMAVSPFRHWVEQEKRLEECPCNAQPRDDPDLDPASDGFWQVQDYFSELSF